MLPSVQRIFASGSFRVRISFSSAAGTSLQKGESLKDTIARLLPYYRGTILPAFEKHDQILVVAHGNSLRGIVKELKGMSNEEIIKFNLPTAVPYVFEFDENMQLVNDHMLGDPEVIAAKMQSVANQAKKK